MADLVRNASHRSLASDDASSLTPFPQLSPSVSRDYDSTNQPLNGLLEGSGPSMFDENTITDASDPQTLSTASADVLRNIIDHHGAIELIRRLSSMLAERDAHITALTRLAEDYKVPRSQINDTASRAKQAERRRLSLATASEDLAPSSGLESESGVSVWHEVIHKAHTKHG
jgi:small G protein signaling modulator 3